MTRARRGRFVVLEGLDGAGTTTQADRLAAWMRQQGRRVHVTAEPSRGPVGALVRQVLARRIVGGGRRAEFDAGALALLFAADRRDHLASEVDPLLATGVDVVCDRFTLSSLAYQSVDLARAGLAPSAGQSMQWVEQLNRLSRAPDLTIFLEVAPATALRRRRAASRDREIFEFDAFQRRVAAAYRAGLDRLRAAGQHVTVVDGRRTVAEVTSAVTRAVAPLL